MTKLWAITSNTFIETIRQPIFMILLLVTYLALVLNVPLAGYSMDTDLEAGDQRMLVDLGLSTLMFSGMFIAAISASSALSREIERRTVLTVVTKPVSRPLILTGKFLGVAAAATVAFYLTAVVFLMTARHGVLSRASSTHDWVVIALGLGAFILAAKTAGFCNYFFGWSFMSTNIAASLVTFTLAGAGMGMITKQWDFQAFGADVSAQLAAVLVLLWMAIVVMTAAATAVSTRLGQMATLGACLGLFALSLITAAIFGPHRQENMLADLAYRVLPNLSYFFALDDLTIGREITGRYILHAAGYGLVWTATALLLGMAMFQRREMDARQSSSSAPAMINAYAWALRLGSLATILVCAAILAGKTSTDNAIIAAVGLPVGAAGWLLAGYLGRGVRSSAWLLMFLTLTQLIASVTFLVFLNPGLLSSEQRVAALAASGGNSLYVLVMCLRPATRSHFARRRSLTETA